MTKLFDDPPFWFVFAICLLGTLAVVGVGAAIIIPVERHYDRSACHSFAVNTNRETKFVVYTIYQWDCLTPTDDGRWISTKNLREFGDTP